MHQLTGIAFSHYVEKARWALERFAVPYEDKRVLPFFHFASVWRLHRGRGVSSDRASSRYSTPVLKLPNGRLLSDSGAIVNYVSDHFAPDGFSLDPGPEGVEIEQRLHDKLGPHTRRLAYSALFEKAHLMRRIAKENVSGLQTTLFSTLVPVASLAMNRALNISHEAAARSIETIQKEMDWLDKHLADGRQWMMGDRFTSADIACACMLAPAVLPPEYSAWIPAIDNLSERVAVPIREFRQRLSGQFALRVFAAERRVVVDSCLH